MIISLNAKWNQTDKIPICAEHTITKTCLYIFDPLKPHFYIVKLGFTGVFIIFQDSAQNIDCGYSLEPPRRGGSNENSQSMFWAESWKNIRIFYLKIFIFLVVKFSVYLNRHVFVMPGAGQTKAGVSETLRPQSIDLTLLAPNIFWYLAYKVKMVNSSYFQKNKQNF